MEEGNPKKTHTQGRLNCSPKMFGILVGSILAAGIVLSQVLVREGKNLPPSAFSLTRSLPIISPKLAQGQNLQTLKSTNYVPQATDYDDAITLAQKGGFSVYHESFVPVKVASVFLCMLEYTGAASVLSKLTQEGSVSSEETYSVYIDNSICDSETEIRESWKWTVQVSLGVEYLGRVEIWREEGVVLRWSVDIYQGVDYDYPAGKFILSYSRSGDYKGSVETDQGLQGPGTYKMKGVHMPYQIPSGNQYVNDYVYQYVADVQSLGSVMNTGSGSAKIWRTLHHRGEFVTGNPSTAFYQMKWNGTLLVVRKSDNDTVINSDDFCYSRDSTVTNVRIYNFFDQATSARSKFAPQLPLEVEGVGTISVEQNSVSGNAEKQFSGVIQGEYGRQMNVKVVYGQMKVTRRIVKSGPQIPTGTVLLATPRDGSERIVYSSGKTGTTLSKSGFYWGVSRKGSGDWKLVAIVQSNSLINFLEIEEAFTPVDGETFNLLWTQAYPVPVTYQSDSLTIIIEKVLPAMSEPKALFCISDCPVANMNQAYVTDGACNDQYHPDPDSKQTMVQYSLEKGELRYQGFLVERESWYANVPCGFDTETVSGKMVDSATYNAATTLQDLADPDVYYEWTASSNKITTSTTVDSDNSFYSVESQRDVFFTHTQGTDIDSSTDFDDALTYLLLWGWDTFGGFFSRNTKPDGDGFSDVYWALPLSKTATCEDICGNVYKIVPVTGFQRLQEVDPEACQSIVTGDPQIPKPLESELVYASNYATAQPADTETWFNEGVCVSVKCQ